MRFYQWLTTHRDRADPVGDIARDATADHTFPRGADDLRSFLAHIGTYQPAREALRHAWAAYKTETAPEVKEMAGILMLSESELDIVQDSLEAHRRRKRPEDDTFEEEVDEQIDDLLKKLKRA